MDAAKNLPLQDFVDHQEAALVEDDHPKSPSLVARLRALLAALAPADRGFHDHREAARFRAALRPRSRRFEGRE